MSLTTSTAHSHMTPFTRLRSFAFQHISMLEKVVKQAEDELKLIWHDELTKKIYDRVLERLSLLEPSLWDERRAFFESLVGETQQRLNAAQRELGFWQKFYSEMQACHNCNGYGNIRTIISQDESRYEKCTCCDGTGQEAQR